MSRFHLVTLLTLAAVVTASLLLRGSERYWTVAAVLSIWVALFAIGMGFIRLQYFTRVICRGEPGRMTVALTFDDGPNPAATPALLDLLQRDSIPATFFCIGKNVADHPDIARRIVADGHLLENHSYYHAWHLMFNRSPGLVREFAKMQEAAQQVTGVTPRYLRPPVGLTNPHFTTACRKLKLAIVGWNVRPFDTAREADDVVKRVIADAKDGSIIVLHDGGTTGERITDIVSRIISGLRAKGLGFERLDRLLES